MSVCRLGPKKNKVDGCKEKMLKIIERRYSPKGKDVVQQLKTLLEDSDCVGKVNQPCEETGQCKLGLTCADGKCISRGF